MKKIWLLTILFVGGLLLTGCNKSIEENTIIAVEPEFTWYYFIAETPASDPISTSFSISDPWNTPLRTW
jgi:hypothetical protein